MNLKQNKMSIRTNFQRTLNRLERQRYIDELQNELNEEFATDELQLDFINSRSESNSFKLTAKDLATLDYKKEIRFLITRKWFPDVVTSNIFLPKLTKAKALNTSLSILEASNSKGFEELLQMQPSGIGPGEILLYFLLDKAIIGGGNSAGIDLIDDGTPYEIKAVSRRSSDGLLHNFKLGGTVNISNVQSKILKLKAELLKFDTKIKEGEKTGINNDHMKGFESRQFLKYCKDNNLETFSELNDEFQTIAYDGYFKNHPIIFMGSKSASKADRGRVYDILTVTKKMVSIYKVTNGTIKPGIKPK